MLAYAPAMRSVSALTVLVALMLTSCGDEGSSSGDPARTTASPSTSNEPAESATDQLGAAIERMAEADSGHFRHELRVSSLDRPMMILSGDYQLRQMTADVAIDAQMPGEDGIAMEVRLVGKRTFMQMEGWPAQLRGCWLTFREDDLRSLTGGPPGGDMVRFPVAVSGLSNARGKTTEGGDVTGSVELRDAAGLLMPKWAAQHARELQKGRTNARFDLSNGKVVGWSVQGDDLASSLREADVEMDSPLRDALGQISGHVTLSGLSEQVEIKAPPESLRMTPEQMDSRQGCRP